MADDPTRPPGDPATLFDLAQLPVARGSVKLAVEQEHPDDRAARIAREAAAAAAKLRREERDADFARWARGIVYALLGGVAFAAGLTAFLSSDPGRRDLGQKVALPVVAGFVGFFLGKQDQPQ